MEQTLSLAYWKLGQLRSDELPEIAADWLAAGLDSRSLRELAGISNPEMSVVGTIFEAAIRELGIQVPPTDEALMIVAGWHAKQIVDGTVSPYEGARKIWWEVSNFSDIKNPLLLIFVGAASEFEELPIRPSFEYPNPDKDRQKLNELIVSKAKELLRVAGG